MQAPLPATMCRSGSGRLSASRTAQPRQPAGPCRRGRPGCGAASRTGSPIPSVIESPSATNVVMRPPPSVPLPPIHAMSSTSTIVARSARRTSPASCGRVTIWRPAQPLGRSQRAGRRPAWPPRLASAPALPGGTRNPVTPSLTRSSGPPAAGATTGSPLADASCSVWPNVSCGPLCTNTSRLA